MCHPNGLVFHQNSLDKDPILVKKSLLEGPISPKLQKKKNLKSAIFEAEKPLKMSPDFAKISKKLLDQPFFDGGKILIKWVRILTSGCTPRPKVICVPPGDEINPLSFHQTIL